MWGAHTEALGVDAMDVVLQVPDEFLRVAFPAEFLGLGHESRERLVHLKNAKPWPAL